MLFFCYPKDGKCLSVCLRYSKWIPELIRCSGGVKEEEPIHSIVHFEWMLWQWPAVFHQVLMEAIFLGCTCVASGWLAGNPAVASPEAHRNCFSHWERERKVKRGGHCSEYKIGGKFQPLSSRWWWYAAIWFEWQRRISRNDERRREDANNFMMADHIVSSSHHTIRNHPLRQFRVVIDYRHHFVYRRIHAQIQHRGCFRTNHTLRIHTQAQLHGQTITMECRSEGRREE